MKKTILGLKLKPSYDELVNDIVEDKDKLKRPNRKFSTLRRSFEYQKFDGIGNYQLEQEELKKYIELERQHLLRQFAHEFGLNLGDVISHTILNNLHPFMAGNTPSTPRERYTTPGPVIEEESDDEFRSPDGPARSMGPPTPEGGVGTLARRSPFPGGVGQTRTSTSTTTLQQAPRGGTVQVEPGPRGLEFPSELEPRRLEFPSGSSSSGLMRNVAGAAATVALAPAVATTVAAATGSIAVGSVLGAIVGGTVGSSISGSKVAQRILGRATELPGNVRSLIHFLRMTPIELNQRIQQHFAQPTLRMLPPPDYEERQREQEMIFLHNIDVISQREGIMSREAAQLFRHALGEATPAIDVLAGEREEDYYGGEEDEEEEDDDLDYIGEEEIEKHEKEVLKYYEKDMADFDEQIIESEFNKLKEDIKVYDEKIKDPRTEPLEKENYRYFKRLARNKLILLKNEIINRKALEEKQKGNVEKKVKEFNLSASSSSSYQIENPISPPFPGEGAGRKRTRPLEVKPEAKSKRKGKEKTRGTPSS